MQLACWKKCQCSLQLGRFYPHLTRPMWIHRLWQRSLVAVSDTLLQILSLQNNWSFVSLLVMVWTVFVQETGEQTACSRQPQEFVFSCAYLFELIRGLRKEKREWKLPHLRSRSRKIRSNSTELVGMRPSSLFTFTTLIMLFQTILPSVF